MYNMYNVAIIVMILIVMRYHRLNLLISLKLDSLPFYKRNAIMSDHV